MYVCLIVCESEAYYFNRKFLTQSLPSVGSPSQETKSSGRQSLLESAPADITTITNEPISQQQPQPQEDTTTTAATTTTTISTPTAEERRKLALQAAQRRLSDSQENNST